MCIRTYPLLISLKLHQTTTKPLKTLYFSVFPKVLTPKKLSAGHLEVDDHVKIRQFIRLHRMSRNKIQNNSSCFGPEASGVLFAPQ